MLIDRFDLESQALVGRCSAYRRRCPGRTARSAFPMVDVKRVAATVLDSVAEHHVFAEEILVLVRGQRDAGDLRRGSFPGSDEPTMNWLARISTRLGPGPSGVWRHGHSRARPVPRRRPSAAVDTLPAHEANLVQRSRLRRTAGAILLRRYGRKGDLDGSRAERRPKADLRCPPGDGHSHPSVLPTPVDRAQARRQSAHAQRPAEPRRGTPAPITSTGSGPDSST